MGHARYDSPMLIAAEARSDFAELDVPWWAWVALVAVIVLMLGIDLVRHRGDKEPTMRVALAESTVWVLCGLSFAVVMLIAFGSEAFGEYISGYLIEKSLSVDNVFVWSMIFGTMAIPLKYQHRVLFWGIFGALTLRAVFIFAGSALIAKFWWLLLVFGVFLVYTGVKVIRHRDDEGEESAQRGVGMLRRFMPVTDKIEGHSFFTRIDGKRAATPLFAALVVVEVTDVIFAVDSIPAIFAITRDPFIVYTSNVFAILGLRALYFMLAGVMEMFTYLKVGLSFVLCFVGVKMMLVDIYKIPVGVSLSVIGGVLLLSILASWLIKPKKAKAPHLQKSVRPDLTQD